MLERLTVGTDITGTFPTMGIWPIDYKRVTKSPTPLEEITRDFTKGYLEEMKGKVKH